MQVVISFLALNKGYKVNKIQSIEKDLQLKSHLAIISIESNNQFKKIIFYRLSKEG